MPAHDLARIGELWGTIGFVHPAVARGAVDWPRALAQAIDALDGGAPLDAVLTALLGALPADHAGGEVVVVGHDWGARGPRARFVDGGDARLVTLDGGAGLPDRTTRRVALLHLVSWMRQLHPYDARGDDGWRALAAGFLPRVDAAEDAAAYAAALADAVATLDDGHARVVIGDGEVGAAPIGLQWIDGAAVVVASADPAIAVGAVVTAIEGVGAGAAIADRSRSTAATTVHGRRQRVLDDVVRGPIGSPLALALDDRAHTLVRIAIAPGPGPSARALDGDLGYVDLRRLTAAEVDGAVAGLALARAAILDLRGYPADGVWALAAHLPTTATHFAIASIPVLTTAGRDRLRFEQPVPAARRPTLTVPIAVLVDERTLSQGEHAALLLRCAGATLIGSPTAGTDGDVGRLRLPGGVTVRYTAIAVRPIDGGVLHGVGLVPAIAARPTGAGLRAGRDEVLEAAIAWATPRG